MKKNFVLLEFGLLDSSVIVWGPFKTTTLAKDFCNRRLEMLASEWGTDDELLTDSISWKVQECSNIE